MLLVVVTYNSFQSLPDLSETIRTFLGHRVSNYAVVVENSLDARVKDFLQEEVHSSRIAVQISPSNEGFSHGVNSGYQWAQDRWGAFQYIVLLNPDVVLAGNIVSELVDRAIRKPDSEVGIWGIVLRDQEGNIDRGCARRKWNRRRFFSHLTGYDNLTRIFLTPPRILTEKEIATNLSDLAMMSGALLCIRGEVMQDGLDTLLPMYLEDQDICMRAKAAGYTLQLQRDLELVHLGGVSRKSVTKHERALRIMELVEAPVQCMLRYHNFTRLELRSLVVMGGVARLVATSIALLAKLAVDRDNAKRHLVWSATQTRLALWFMIWAMRGRIHRKEVSMSSYFREYDDV